MTENQNRPTIKSSSIPSNAPSARGSNRPWAFEDLEIGRWLSAALDDEHVADEMKYDITAWFDTFEPYRST
jgi:hypothetical protein